MTDVKKILESSGLDGWRVNETATQSYELFFVHQKLETVRATDTVTAAVTVYADHDGKKGDSSFSLTPAMDETEIRQKIAAAVSRAQLVRNEPYTLPEAAELDQTMASNMWQEDPKALGQRIAQAVFAADTLPGGSINACEIFLYRDTVRVQNSRGVDKTQRQCRVMIEAIPTFTEGEESVELYEDYRFTEFDPARVTAEIARRMAEARDRFQAKKPQTPMTINVLLRPQEIRELLEELTYDLNYASVYMHSNLHKIGDDLQQGGPGDKLTVTMKAQVPGSERSSCFDTDGGAFTDACVIKDGVAVQNYGGSRFGQYLGVEKPTGDLPCLRLETGSLSEKEMKAQPYLECASLSGLQLDLYNDYIGGEIRLAYYFDGEKTVPVTGISMSGKLSQALSSLRLSNSPVTDGSYEGPSLLLMPGVAIL